MVPFVMRERVVWVAVILLGSVVSAQPSAMTRVRHFLGLEGDHDYTRTRTRTHDHDHHAGKKTDDAMIEAMHEADHHVADHDHMHVHQMAWDMHGFDERVSTDAAVDPDHDHDHAHGAEDAAAVPAHGHHHDMHAFEFDDQCFERCYELFKESLPPKNDSNALSHDAFPALVHKWCADVNDPGFKLHLSKIRTDRACQKDRLEELHDHPAATLWATLPYSFAELRHSSIILDSCMTGSLGLPNSCWPFGPIHTHIALDEMEKAQAQAR